MAGAPDPMRFDFPVLLADIGGTNVRVGLAREPTAAPALLGKFETRAEVSIEDGIARIARDAGAKPRAAILAAAGPVTGARMAITNATRLIDAGLLAQALDLEAAAVVNDFAAQAAAIATLDEADLFPIHAGKPVKSGTRLAIGPGTGFGVGFIVAADQNSALVVASEGGHAGFAPETEEEALVWPHLPRVEGRTTIESVLCGDGIAHLHRALARVEGAPAPADAPAATVEAARNGQQRARRAIALYLDLMARAAGDLALVAKATGGVHLCGGVMPRLLPFLDAGRFRARFAARPPMADMLAGMPLSVVTAEEPALRGLAALAAPEAGVRAAEMAVWRR